MSDKKISEHLANIFVKQVQLPLLLYNIRHTYDKDKYLFRVLHQLPSRALWLLCQDIVIYNLKIYLLKNAKYNEVPYVPASQQKP